MDYFTTWPESYAIPNQEASAVAEALVTNVCRFGVPDLYSDQGRNCESRLMKEAFKHLGVNKVRTTPLHPQSDGYTSKRSRSTYERSSHRTRGIWMQDRPSFSWLKGQPFTTLRASPPLA
jgi:hypothetical protein